MQKWEYKTIKVETFVFHTYDITETFDPQIFDDAINQLGSDGWELVSAFNSDKIKNDTIAVFKRQLI